MMHGATLIRIRILWLLMMVFFSMPAMATKDLNTLKKGVLTIGTYFTNPPFEFMDNNKQIGFEVDIINEIAKRLNLQPQFVNTTWEVVTKQLIDHHYDVIMGAITITPERKKYISFTNPYMTTTLAFIINKQRTPTIKKINDLKDQRVAVSDLKDDVVGVQAKTTDYNIAMKMKKQGLIAGVATYPFANFNAAIDDLVKGKIGAVMKVYPVAYYYVEKYPQLAILESVPHDPQPLGFGVNFQSSALLAALNQAQNDMKKDGTYQKIYQHWFGKR